MQIQNKWNIKYSRVTKNIYDLAGNVSEWTMENYNNANRVNRGGFYNNNGNTYPASHRNNSAVTASANTIGVRQALVIMNIPYICKLSNTNERNSNNNINKNTRVYTRISKIYNRWRLDKYIQIA